jgi:hypothetical protein
MTTLYWARYVFLALLVLVVVYFVLVHYFEDR